jgi:uncharacterized protein YukE
MDERSNHAMNTTFSAKENGARKLANLQFAWGGHPGRRFESQGN